MNQRNYEKEREALIKNMNQRPTLLLQVCCAPCSSAVLERLMSDFVVTVFFYNPNITEEAEYEKRKQEEIRFLEEYPFEEKPVFYEGKFEPEKFYQIAKGLEMAPEGGERCYHCYELRLRETAQKASEEGFDYYCTTLSVSPYKHADKLMEIGERLAEEYHVKYLPSDFKKKNGYKRSIELSREYHLYRQNYCGCIYSKAARDREELHHEE